MKKTCKNCNHFLHCVRVYNLCSCCNDYEAKPMTEQEYIQTCNTEQLAEHLLNVWMDGAFNVNAEFGLSEAQIEQHKGYIVEWLKQPHTPKE